MEKLNKVDFEEVWAVFISSSAKLKFVVLLLVLSIVSISVIFFGIYAFPIWIVMLILLASYEEILYQFIIIDYQFLTPPPLFMIKPRNPSIIKESLNRVILSDMRLRYPGIVFKVNGRDDRTAMKTFILDGVNHIEIDHLALMVFSPEEFQAVIYHELGHVALKHIDESKLLVFLGYVVFIFLPILLPLFWLIGSYISRYHEFEADKFSLKHDPNHYVLKAQEGVKLEKMKADFWTNLWCGFLYATVAPSPSLNMKIKSLRRVKSF